jgi:hypothetical protein
MQQMARKPFMDFTMIQRDVAVKSRKSAVFTAQIVPPCLMVNHY